jgi:hypothetical protein
MQGVLDPWSGLDRIREMAAELNLGIRSISRLNIEQRRALIDRLIEMGAQVKNPVIYDSDRPAASPRLPRLRKSNCACSTRSPARCDGAKRTAISGSVIRSSKRRAREILGK